MKRDDVQKMFTEHYPDCGKSTHRSWVYGVMRYGKFLHDGECIIEMDDLRNYDKVREFLDTVASNNSKKTIVNGLRKLASIDGREGLFEFFDDLYDEF